MTAFEMICLIIQAKDRFISVLGSGISTLDEILSFLIVKLMSLAGKVGLVKM